MKKHNLHERFPVRIIAPMSTSFTVDMEAQCYYTSNREDFILVDPNGYRQGFGFAYKGNFIEIKDD